MADAPREGWGTKHEQLAKAAGHKSWTDWCAELEAAAGFKICGRTAGAKGPNPHPCGKAAGAGTKHGESWGACKFHGGDSKAGPEAGAYKHGGRMDKKYQLRGNLAATWERLQGDLDNAFDLEADARLLDARMAYLVESLPEDPATPRALRRAVSEARSVVLVALRPSATKEHKKAAADALGKLDERLASSLNETQVWEDWRRLVEQKRKLADTKARQDQREHGPVLWQDVVMVTERVRQIIMEHVPQGEQSNVLKKFRAMLERPGQTTS